jgi:large subunit ribosomal protein L4
VQGTVVLVDAAIDKNLSLASRNVASVEVATADGLNTYQVLRPNKIVITRSALEKLEARLKD